MNVATARRSTAGRDHDGYSIRVCDDLADELRDTLNNLRPQIFDVIEGSELSRNLDDLRANHDSDSEPVEEGKRVARGVIGSGQPHYTVGLTEQGWTRGMVDHAILPHVTLLRKQFNAYHSLRAKLAEVGKKLKMLRRLASSSTYDRVRSQEEEKFATAEITRLHEVLAACQNRKPHPDAPEIDALIRIEAERRAAEAESKKGKSSYYGFGRYVIFAVLIFGVDFFANYEMLRGPLITAATDAFFFALSITAFFLFASHFIGGSIKASFTWGGEKGLRRTKRPLSLWEKTGLVMAIAGLFMGFYLLIGPRLFLFNPAFGEFPTLGEMLSWISSWFGDANTGTSEDVSGRGSSRIDLSQVNPPQESVAIENPALFFWFLLVANTVLLVFGISNATAYHESVTTLPMIKKRANHLRQKLEERKSEIGKKIAELSDAPRDVGFRIRVIAPLTIEFKELSELLEGYAPEPHVELSLEYLAERMNSYQIRMLDELKKSAPGRFTLEMVRLRKEDGSILEFDEYAKQQLLPTPDDLIKFASDRGLVPRLVGQTAKAANSP